MRGSAFCNKHHNAFRDTREDEVSGEAVNWRPRPEWALEGPAVTGELSNVSFQCWIDSQKWLQPSTDEIAQQVQWCQERGLPV